MAKKSMLTKLLLAGLLMTVDSPVIAAEKIHASYGAISGSMAPIWVAKEAK